VDPTYCRLYLDTDEHIAIVRAVMDDLIGQMFDELPAEGPVYRNLNFVPRARDQRPYDPIACSPLTAEVGAIDAWPENGPAFQGGAVRLVRALRERGYVVTASCDFEDRIAAETGWNWTEDTPEPPRF
jgi:hypothetical protein